MPIPSYPSLMLPVLKLFEQGATSINECIPAIKAEFGISDEDARALIPAGTATVLFSRIHRARMCLSKAGFLEFTPRRMHVISAKGRRLLASIRLTNGIERRDLGREPPPNLSSALVEARPRFARPVPMTGGATTSFSYRAREENLRDPRSRP